jgi:hypothetical protein
VEGNPAEIYSVELGTLLHSGAINHDNVDEVGSVVLHTSPRQVANRNLGYGIVFIFFEK